MSQNGYKQKKGFGPQKLNIGFPFDFPSDPSKNHGGPSTTIGLSGPGIPHTAPSPGRCVSSGFEKTWIPFTVTWPTKKGTQKIRSDSVLCLCLAHDTKNGFGLNWVYIIA